MRYFIFSFLLLSLLIPLSSAIGNQTLYTPTNYSCEGNFTNPCSYSTDGNFRTESRSIANGGGGEVSYVYSNYSSPYGYILNATVLTQVRGLTSNSQYSYYNRTSKSWSDLPLTSIGSNNDDLDCPSSNYTASLPGDAFNSSNTVALRYTINGGSLVGIGCKGVTSTADTYLTINNVSGGAVISTSSSCSGGLVPYYYFDFRDEQNRSLTANNLVYNIKYGLTEALLPLYGSLSGASSFYLCLNKTVSSTWVVSSAELDYSGSLYVPRQYFVFDNTTLSNNTISNTTINTLLSSAETTFTVSSKDTSLTPYVGKYLVLLRWYPDLNEYKVVDMGLTDDKGNAIIHVVVEDVDYRLALYEKDGRLIKLANPLRMVCSSAPCEYSFIVTSSSGSYTNAQKVFTNLTYNPTTKIFTYIWSDPTATTTSMNLTVVRTYGQISTTVCSNLTNGFVGAITCNVSAYSSGIFDATVYRTASPATVISNLLITIKDTIVNAGGKELGAYFTWLLILVAGIIGFFISPILGIVFSIVALVPATMMGSVTAAFVLAIVVVAFAVIHMMRRT